MLFFFGLWLVLADGDAGAWLPGLLAAVAATWTSLRLLPPPPGRVRRAALPGLALRFLKHSLLGGLDACRHDTG
jgi:multicomponent Na+:H+ antiporter subunit E